jgi:hypothetical protein
MTCVVALSERQLNADEINFKSASINNPVARAATGGDQPEVSRRTWEQQTHSYT